MIPKGVPLTKDEWSIILQKITSVDRWCLSVTQKPSPLPERFAEICEFHGYIELLKWADVWSGKLEHAICGKQMDMFLWLIKNNNIYSYGTSIQLAGIVGFLPLIQWFYEQGFDVRDGVLRGHWFITKWALDCGIIDKRAILFWATRRDNLEFVKQIDFRIDWNFWFIHTMYTKSNLKILQWILENRYITITPEILRIAVSNGNHRAIQLINDSYASMGLHFAK